MKAALKKKILISISAFLFAVFFSICAAQISSADSQGPLFPLSASVDSGISGANWVIINNIKLEDDKYAYSSVYNSHSKYAKGTNFGFSIPAGKQIKGIVAEIKRCNASLPNSCHDYEVKLVKSDGTINPTNKADTLTYYPLYPFVYASYGSPTDTWGCSWTPNDINSGNFGLVLSVYGQDEVMVDCFRITVYYSDTQHTHLGGTMRIKNAHIK